MCCNIQQKTKSRGLKPYLNAFYIYLPKPIYETYFIIDYQYLSACRLTKSNVYRVVNIMENNLIKHLHILFEFVSLAFEFVASCLCNACFGTTPEWLGEKGQSSLPTAPSSMHPDVD